MTFPAYQHVTKKHRNDYGRWVFDVSVEFKLKHPCPLTPVTMERLLKKADEEEVEKWIICSECRGAVIQKRHAEKTKRSNGWRKRAKRFPKGRPS